MLLSLIIHVFSLRVPSLRTQIFKLIILLRNAGWSFFSDIIAKNNNKACALFASVDRLTNPPVSVACEFLSTQGLQGIWLFLQWRTYRICIVLVSTDKINSNCMTQLDPINHKNLEGIIQHPKSFPAALIICHRVFQKGLPQIFYKLSTCLFLSGFFPQALKTTIIKPL